MELFKTDSQCTFDIVVVNMQYCVNGFVAFFKIWCMLHLDARCHWLCAWTTWKISQRTDRRGQGTVVSACFDYGLYRFEYSVFQFSLFFELICSKINVHRNMQWYIKDITLSYNDFSVAPHTLTRKPSWCKAERVTSVHVWRPIAKKSTTEKTICNFLLIVDNNHGCITYHSCYIFARGGWKLPILSVVFWL